MVFQLPVVDFPDHSAIEQMSAYDLIKEGYLHSKTLRWSSGGIRGRDGEWQFPASALPMHDLLRGVAAMGFSAVMLDRNGFPDHADLQLHQLEHLLGAPIATRGQRLVAWDLRPATASLLGDLDAAGRQALVQQLLDAPRLYLASDAEPLTDRGDPHEICARGQLTIVNPGRHTVRQTLRITMHQRISAAQHGRVQIGPRSVTFRAGSRGRVVTVEVQPGNTHLEISVDTPGARCRSVPPALLPTVSAELVAGAGAPNS